MLVVGLIPPNLPFCLILATIFYKRLSGLGNVRTLDLTKPANDDAGRQFRLCLLDGFEERGIGITRSFPALYNVVKYFPN